MCQLANQFGARFQPLLRRIIPSGEPVLGVLELNSAQIGIEVGDKISHPMFNPH